MALSNLELEILEEASAIFNNPRLTMHNIRWSKTANFTINIGEEMTWLPSSAVYVIINRKHDRRKRG